VQGATVGPLSSSLSSSRAPPRLLIGHAPGRAYATPMCAVRLREARRSCTPAAAAGASAGAAARLGWRREPLRERERERPPQRTHDRRADGLVRAARRPVHTLFIALRVPVLLLPVRELPGLSGHETDAVRCLRLRWHTSRHVCVHGCSVPAACVGHVVLGNSLELRSWAGWSCRRKPHGNCLK